MSITTLVSAQYDVFLVNLMLGFILLQMYITEPCFLNDGFPCRVAHGGSCERILVYLAIAQHPRHLQACVIRTCM